MTLDERLRAIDGLNENQIRQIKMAYKAAGWVDGAVRMYDLTTEIDTVRLEKAIRSAAGVKS